MAQQSAVSVQDISVSDLVVVVMGLTGSGKTTFISRLVGEDVGIGHGLVSETASVSAFVFTHSASGRRVYLIDTPGFNDTNRSDADVLGDIAFVLAQLYQRSVLLSGLVYLTDITRNRMDGSGKKMLRVFREVCGAQAFPHVILLSTKWESLVGSTSGLEAARRNEAELIATDAFWGALCRGGARTQRWDGTRESALEVVDCVEELQGQRGKPALAIQIEMVDDGRELHETTAGRTVLEELLEQEQRFRAQMAELEADYERALRRKNSERTAELKKQRAQLEASVRLVTRSQQKLLVSLKQLSAQKVGSYVKEIARLRSEIKRLEVQMREHRSRPVKGHGGFHSSGSQTGDRGMAAMKREHSRLVKAQRALGVLGVVAGLGLAIAGGATANPALLAIGIGMAGGGFSQARGSSIRRAEAQLDDVAN